MGKASLTFYIPIEKEDFNQICSKALSKIPDSTYTVNDDKIIFKESRAVKTGTYRGLYGAKSEITIDDNNNVTINTKCQGFAPIQTRHAEDMNRIIKRKFESVINNDIEEDDPDVIKCPVCGSSQIEIVKRGWTLATGFLGSGKNERICKNCMYKF